MVDYGKLLPSKIYNIYVHSLFLYIISKNKGKSLVNGPKVIDCKFMNATRANYTKFAINHF